MQFKKQPQSKPLVLDTNVVLNWLFFRDTATVAVIQTLLNTAATDGYYWVSTPWMQHEAQRVAHSPHLSKYANPTAFEALNIGFTQYATVFENNAVPIASALLRCRDVDDQAFLDLALHTAAPLLLTLDRDLLKMKKRATSMGLSIVQPSNSNIEHLNIQNSNS